MRSLVGGVTYTVTTHPTAEKVNREGREWTARELCAYWLQTTRRRGAGLRVRTAQERPGWPLKNGDCHRLEGW